MSPRILPLVCVLGACTIPSIPKPEPLPPLPPRVTAVSADTPEGAVADTTPADEVPPEAVAAEPAARVHPPETVALFVANCAQCHGEKGDGEGVTQLDRKARSFLEGGFSYGNTPDAIFRSITHGIPGTPMPGFEKPLSEAQRRELTAYVIALGPEREPVDTKAKEMIVKDRAVVVRGKLPALVEGGPEFPRGLAIGTPDGLTFEYRVDDVQLIAVRAGAFVNRTDWGDRGGQPLEMLGQVIWSAKPKSCEMLLTLARDHEGLPRALEQRHTRLIATQVRGDRAEVEYVLTGGRDSDRFEARVRESCSAFRNSRGSGFLLVHAIRADGEAGVVQVGDWEARQTIGVGKGSMATLASFGSPEGKESLIVSRVRAEKQPSIMNGMSGAGCLFVRLPAGTEQVVEVIVLTDLSGPIDLDDNHQVGELIKEFEL